MDNHAPVGSMVLYPGVNLRPGQSTYPDHNLLESKGWMLCDGRTLPASAYPSLFGVIGYAYGGNHGSFCVPDYRSLAIHVPTEIPDPPPPSYYIIKCR